MPLVYSQFLWFIMNANFFRTKLWLDYRKGGINLQVQQHMCLIKWYIFEWKATFPSLGTHTYEDFVTIEAGKFRYQ
jgi:hypothetical protein